MIDRPNNRYRPFALYMLVALLIMTPTVWAQQSTGKGTATTHSNSSPNPTSGSKSDCRPTNCPITCNPGCTDGKICSVESSADCGVCPRPICIDQSAIGLGPSKNGSDSDSGNSSLLPGLLGGLGALLVIAIGGFVFYRHKKQGAIGQTFFGKPKVKQLGSKDDMRSWGNGTSAVIPIAFIPPGQNGDSAKHGEPSFRISLNFANNSTITPPPPAAGTGLSLGFQKTYDQRNSTRSENPFDDLDDEESVQVKTAAKTVMAMGSTTTLQTFDPSSSVSTFNLGSPADNLSMNRLTVDSEYFGSDGDRDSVATVGQPAIASVVATQAVQVLRAKPQMMRINTIRNNDNNNLSRSGSVRTMMSHMTTNEAAHNVIDMENNFSSSDITVASAPTSFQPEVLNVISPKDTEPSSSIPQSQSRQPAGEAMIEEESQQSEGDSAVEQRNQESPFDNRHSVVDNDDDEEDEGAGAHVTLVRGHQAPTTLADPVDEQRLSVAALSTGGSSDRTASMLTARTHRTNATNSVVSTPGDGEITIMWSGYQNSEEQAMMEHDEKREILEVSMDGTKKREDEESEET